MHTSNPGWQRNNHWCVCQICGFDYRRDEMMTTWDGKDVCKYDFESRHPQELVRARKDNQSPVGIHTGQPTDEFVDVTFTAVSDNTLPSSSFNTDIL